MQIWCKFGDSSSELLHETPNFLNFQVKMAKLTLKVKVNDLHFQYQPRISQDTCMVQISMIRIQQQQIGDSNPNL